MSDDSSAESKIPRANDVSNNDGPLSEPSVMERQSDAANTTMEEVGTVEGLGSTAETLSDWQTYRSITFGFAVKYPKDWIALDLKKGDLDGIVELGGVEFSSPDNQNVVRVIVNPESLNDAATRYKHEGVSSDKITINNADGIRTKGGIDETLGTFPYVLGNNAYTFIFLSNTATSTENIIGSFVLLP